MKKIIAAGLIMTTAIMGVSSTVSASNQPTAQVTITPRLCVIDVVQDGSSQTLQSGLQDCDAALPILLSSPANLDPSAPSAQRPNALFAVPFAGVPVQQTTDADASGPLAPPTVDGTLTRIANIDPAQVPASTPAQSDVMTVVFGATLALGTIAAGVDIAVFELRYTRRFLATARQCISLLKR